MQPNIKQLLATILPAAKDWKGYLLRNWRNLVGPLHKKMTIEKIGDGVVVFGVHDSCWMQELYLLSPLLLKAVNKNLDQPYVKQVRFKRAKRRATRSEQPVYEKPKSASPVRPPTKQECTALEAVKDKELRSALEAFRARCHREK